MLVEMFLEKILLSIFIGALLGMERQYHKKQEIVGMRTFALISLIGTTTVLISSVVESTLIDFSSLGMIFVSSFALIIYVNSIIKKKGPGFTTTISLLIAYILGTMIGHNLLIESVFLSITVAVILFSREKMHEIVKHLTQKEVGDLLEFLILLGIIYPIIPNEFTFYGITIPVMLIWFMIVLVSIINFVAFFSARYLSGTYQIELVSFLGGMMSSIASTIAISNFYNKNPKRLATILAGFFTINAGLTLRNLLIVAIPAPEILPYALVPFTIIIGSFLLFSYYTLKKVIDAKKNVKPIKVESPFNVSIGLKLGLSILILFVLLDLAGQLGMGSFFLTSFVGGIVSSTATCISLAGLISSGAVDPITGTFSLFLANAGSMFFAWAICYRNGSPDIIKYSAKQIFLVTIISLLMLFITVGAVIY